MSSPQALCEHCRHPLNLKRTCTSVSFCCPQCAKEFPLSRFIHLMDEEMEAQLAGIRCDRV